MSKYKAGDQFIVTIKEVMESENGTLYRSNFSTLVFDDYGLDALQKSKPEPSCDDVKAAYDRGLNDAWELARKLYDMKCEELEKIFVTNDSFYEVIRTYTPQETLEMLKAYEDSKNLQVGDVVEIISKYSESHKFYGIILTLGLDIYWVLSANYTIPQKLTISNYRFKKTGKHIDFQEILKQIE